MIQDIAPKKFHIEYKNIQPTLDDTVFVFRGSSKPVDRALVKQENRRRIIPTLRELQAAGYAQDSEQLQFLFAIDDRIIFCSIMAAWRIFSCRNTNIFLFETFGIVRRNWWTKSPLPYRPRIICFSGIEIIPAAAAAARA